VHLARTGNLLRDLHGLNISPATVGAWIDAAAQRVASRRPRWSAPMSLACPWTASCNDQRAFGSGHHPGTDPNPLSDHELVKWLPAMSAKVRAKKLDLSVGDWVRFSVLSHDRQRSGRLQHFCTFL
jgi:hypothetical protein